MTPAGAKSTWGKYTAFYLIHPVIKPLVLQRLNYKIGRNKVPVLSNQTCFEKKILPIYIYIYINCVCEFVCACGIIYLFNISSTPGYLMLKFSSFVNV